VVEGLRKLSLNAITMNRRVVGSSPTWSHLRMKVGIAAGLPREYRPSVESNQGMHARLGHRRFRLKDIYGRRSSFQPSAIVCADGGFRCFYWPGIANAMLKLELTSFHPGRVVLLGGVATSDARPEKPDEALLLLALREGAIDPGIPEE